MEAGRVQRSDQRGRVKVASDLEGRFARLGRIAGDALHAPDGALDGLIARLAAIMDA